MANVTLDAMIARADFALKSENPTAADSVASLSVENLLPTGLFASLIRKPDFQRETNHWSPNQLVSFLESFLDSELIPSVILWKSDSFVFVIDGGHRVSALRAWIEDDYGDGLNSQKYFSHEISQGQKRIAKRTRDMVDANVGSYKKLRDALLDPSKYDEKTAKRAQTMATRSLNLQWVSGDADKAESSFFKINTLGTPLDKTEELLLRNRQRTIALAARSIVRAATGHKYWSKFPDAERKQIEERAKALHEMLFNPEVQQPLKTLDLPLGGDKSPLDALSILMELIAICSLENHKPRAIKDFPEDSDGKATIKLLDKCADVVGHITGNEGPSLGLHPAIFFYSERGRHIPDLLLGIALTFSRKLADNNRAYFKRFTLVRSRLEALLVEHKSLITQALQTVQSRARPDRVAEFFDQMVTRLEANDAISETDIASTIAAASTSKVLSIHKESGGVEFKKETKSEAFIRQSIETAIACPECGGKLDPTKSISYDHKKGKKDGGKGDVNNVGLTHPYCNSRKN